jgi:stage IV sporulation protein FB
MSALYFRLGSIPVRIHGIFLITALLLSAMDGASVPGIAIRMVIILASVLFHELGHALSGMVFGLRPQIELHGMGGTTSWIVDPANIGETRERLSPWRSIVVSFSGPFFGFILGGAVYFGQRYLPHDNLLVDRAVKSALWINLGWSVFNLFPILPLDGGNILASVFRWVTGGKGQFAARYVSIVLAVVLAGLMLWQRQLWTGMLALSFIVQNVRGLTLMRRLSSEEPLKDSVELGKQAIDARDGRAAIGFGETIVRGAVTMEMRREGIKLIAYGQLLEGHWAQLMQLLDAAKVELGASELARFEETVRELGRPDDAAQIHEWVNLTAGFKAHSG